MGSQDLNLDLSLFSFFSLLHKANIDQHARISQRASQFTLFSTHFPFLAHCHPCLPLPLPKDVLLGPSLTWATLLSALKAVGLTSLKGHSRSLLNPGGLSLCPAPNLLFSKPDIPSAILRLPRVPSLSHLPPPASLTDFLIPSRIPLPHNSV